MDNTRHTDYPINNSAKKTAIRQRKNCPEDEMSACLNYTCLLSMCIVRCWDEQAARLLYALANRNRNVICFFLQSLFSSPVVASYDRCVINTWMISGTSLISNECLMRQNDNRYFSLYSLSSDYWYDLFYRQEYGGKIEATTNQTNADWWSIDRRLEWV
jgi:hypothetical protein